MNLDNPEDIEMVFRILEETNEEEEENFELYLSDKKDEDQMPENNLSENTDSIPFTHEELCEPLRLQITEEALIHESSNYNKMQT